MIVIEFQWWAIANFNKLLASNHLYTSLCFVNAVLQFLGFETHLPHIGWYTSHSVSSSPCALLRTIPSEKTVSLFTVLHSCTVLCFTVLTFRLLAMAKSVNGKNTHNFYDSFCSHRKSCLSIQKAYIISFFFSTFCCCCPFFLSLGISCCHFIVYR